MRSECPPLETAGRGGDRRQARMAETEKGETQLGHEKTEVMQTAALCGAGRVVSRIGNDLFEQIVNIEVVAFWRLV